MNSEGIRKTLIDAGFEEVRELCERVGEDKLIEGKKVGHTHAFLGCTSIHDVDRFLKNIGRYETEIDRMEESINKKRNEFDTEIKPYKEAIKKDKKEIKGLEKRTEQKLEFIKNAKYALEMILKGEL